MKRTIFYIFVTIVFSHAFAGELQDLFILLTPAPTETENSNLKPTSPPGMIAVGTFPFKPISPESEHGIEEIGLEQTQCYSGCPAFTFIVKEDGSFRYFGEYAVERIGQYSGKIEKGQLNQLLKFIDEIDFFSLKDSYTSQFLDSSTSYIMVKQNGKIKVIENYANSGPAILWAIEELINDLLRTAVWDPVGGDR